MSSMNATMRDFRSTSSSTSVPSTATSASYNYKSGAETSPRYNTTTRDDSSSRGAATTQSSGWQASIVSSSQSTRQESQPTTSLLATSQNGLALAPPAGLTEYQKLKLELYRNQNQLLERIVKHLEQNRGARPALDPVPVPVPVPVERKKLVVVTDDSGFPGVFQPVIEAIEEGIRKKSLPFDIVQTTLASVNSVPNGFFYLVLIPCSTCRPDGTAKFACLQKSNQVAVFIYQTNNENGIQARSKYTSYFRSGVNLDVKEDIRAETEGVSFAVSFGDKRIFQPYQHNTTNMDRLLELLQQSLRV